MPTIPGDTASERSFAWASRVLQNCLKSHSSCNGPTVAKLPSRVLDLGPPEEPRVKLLETSDTSGTYACLSHCWGKVTSIQTEKKTLPLFRDSIAWSSLPQTFQDAIHFVRKLGLRYLWIDSLCIIQDDPEDWRQESAKMSSIYQDSYITIAATKSANADGGCYSDATPFDIDHELTMTFQGRTPAQVYVREKVAHFDVFKVDNSRSLFPLLSRGWAFQERLLAPRVLHFCKKELVWECQEFSSCECRGFKPSANLRRELALHFVSRVVPVLTEIEKDPQDKPPQTRDSSRVVQSSAEIVPEETAQPHRRGRNFLSRWLQPPRRIPSQEPPGRSPSPSPSPSADRWEELQRQIEQQVYSVGGMYPSIPTLYFQNSRGTNPHARDSEGVLA